MDDPYRKQVNCLGLVSARFEPKISLKGYARGKGEGAFKGASSAFWGYFNAISEADCSGELCGGVIALTLLGIPVATAVGAIAGAYKAEPKAKVEHIEKEATTSFEKLEFQKIFQDRLFEKIRTNKNNQVLVVSGDTGPIFPDKHPSYAFLSDMGMDAVLESSILEVGTQAIKGSINGPIVIFLKANIHMVRTRDDTVIFNKKYTYTSTEKKLSDWAENNWQSFSLELERGFRDIASRAATDIK